MLTVAGSPQRICDGKSRRDVLRIGALGGFGLTLADLLRAEPAKPSDSSFGRAKRCILLFLTGGPPQHDTFDPKPEAPRDIRGEFKPIATNVPGVFVAELFPRLARSADKYCIVRAVAHSDTVHTSAGYTMLTGVYHPLPNQPTANLVRPTPNDHPHLGSIVGQVRGWRNGMPPFVALPEVIKDAAVNEFPGQGAGFLGRIHGPLRVEADAAKCKLKIPDMVLPADISAGRLDQRRRLRAAYEGRLQRIEGTGQLDDVNGFYRRAFELLGSKAVRKAFDLDQERASTRDRYGPHLFGQGCLLARRLVEAGVGLVTVYWHYEGPDDSPVWDTHWNNFRHLRERLAAPTDQAVSALYEDLSMRSLLEDTLVICMGEFGRTPKINSMAGRDHWPHVQSILLAGGGIRGGTVYGASDAQGAYPKEGALRPGQLFATYLHLMGIPPQTELRDVFGRSFPAANSPAVADLLRG